MGRPPRNTIVDGVRSAGNQAQQQVPEDGDGYVSTRTLTEIADARVSGAGDVAPFVEYQSRYANLRWSVEINHDVLIDGRVIRAKDKNIQFTNFIYRTNDPKMIQYIESRPNYGVGRVVWRTQDLTDAMLSDQINKTIGMLQAANRHSPKALGALAKRLGEEDFDILSSLASYAKSQKPEAEKQSA